MTTTLFIGVPGSGKTLAMQDMVSMAVDADWPCLVIDRALEWLPHDLEGQPNARWRGRAPRIVRIPFTDDDAALDAIQTDLSDNGAAVYVFEGFDGWKPMSVAKLTGLVGDAYYVDDEIDIFATYKAWDASPLKEYLHRGRHTPDADGHPRQVNILGAMRRPQNVHTDLTSLADEAFIFRVQGEKTVSRLINDGFILSAHEGDVQRQPDLSFVRWRNNGPHVKGRLLPIAPSKALSAGRAALPAKRDASTYVIDVLPFSQ